MADSVAYNRYELAVTTSRAFGMRPPVFSVEAIVPFWEIVPGGAGDPGGNLPVTWIGACAHSGRQSAAATILNYVDLPH